MFNGTLTHQCVLLNFKAICNVLVIVIYSDQTFPWFKVTIQYHLKSPLSHFHLVYRCTQYNKSIINTLTVTSFVSLDASEAMVLTLLYSFDYSVMISGRYCQNLNVMIWKNSETIAFVRT